MLLDNGRTRVLRDEVGRQALHCIRCSACLNVCPVYTRTGGHAYGSVYPGPIGAILTPQLIGIENASSLPFASTLCGACYEVCPVKIDIPRVLLHLRGEGSERRARSAERTLLMRAGGVDIRKRAWRLRARPACRLASHNVPFLRVGSAPPSAPAPLRAGRARAICAVSRSRASATGGGRDERVPAPRFLARIAAAGRCVR